MMNKFLICLLCMMTTTTFAQLGGKKSFEFLNVPNNARLAALGGVNVSLADRDINFMFSNPSLTGDTLAGFASAGYQFYVADVGQTTAAYAHQFKKIGTLTFGVQYLSYGEIQSYDATGADLGNYRSGESAIFVSKSHQISNFRIGATLKVAFSSIAGYRANAVMMDLGGLFIHPQHDFTLGIVIRNAGLLLSDYSETSSSRLPFDVRIGATLKPEHMPLRFSLTAYNLTEQYEPDASSSNGDEAGTLQQIFRHLNFGAEVLLHRNVNVMVGYNYLVHRELKLENAGGSAGVSFGFSARIRSFEFVFSRSTYMVGNAGYTFTISKNIDTLLSRGSNL
jgi:hypothetical protein